MRAPYSWQRDAWNQLIERQQRGDLMQAILLTGQRGVGKAAFVRELAATGLCQRSEEQSCQQCDSCRQIAAGSHPDLLQVAVLEDKKEILIDQIRQFCQDIQFTASQGRGRYALIFGADRLNTAAANALLKTLEEPPPRTTLLLTADQLVRMPATIRSRCTRIAMPSPDEDQATAWLREHDLDDGLWRRRQGPCALLEDGEAAITAQQEKEWMGVLQQLAGNGDSLSAAQQVGENHVEAFIFWWQEQLLDEMKHGRAAMSMRRLWDALIKVRAQSHLNFNRLLALEGLFILYLQLARQSRAQT